MRPDLSGRNAGARIDETVLEVGLWEPGAMLDCGEG